MSKVSGKHCVIVANDATGQMGNEKVKVQNLRVLKVVPEKNILVVKGCVPGHKNAYVIVQK